MTPPPTTAPLQNEYLSIQAAEHFMRITGITKVFGEIGDRLDIFLRDGIVYIATIFPTDDIVAHTIAYTLNQLPRQLLLEEHVLDAKVEMIRTVRQIPESVVCVSAQALAELFIPLQLIMETDAMPDAKDHLANSSRSLMNFASFAYRDMQIMSRRNVLHHNLHQLGTIVDILSGHPSLQKDWAEIYNGIATIMRDVLPSTSPSMIDQQVTGLYKAIKQFLQQNDDKVRPIVNFLRVADMNQAWPLLLLGAAPDQQPNTATKLFSDIPTDTVTRDERADRARVLAAQLDTGDHDPVISAYTRTNPISPHTTNRHRS